MKDAIDRMLCRFPGFYRGILRVTRRNNLEKRAFLTLLRAGDVVFDVGANRGHFTRLFSRIVGKRGAVHAFEPGPDAFELLRSRMETAGGPRNWTLNHCALGETAGTATLHLPGDDDGQASLRVQAHGSWSQASEVRHFDCRVRTLDEYALGLERVDFLKCDVEGAELAVLRGGHSTLVRHLPLLWLESNPEWTRAFGYTPADLIAELRTTGYDTFLAAGPRLAPLEEGDLEGNVNLLCAHSGVHAARLARVTKI